MKKVIWVFLVLIVTACGEKLLKTPEDLIPEEKMISILMDLAIVNSAKNTNAGLLLDQNIDPTGSVFAKYGIDSLQFVTSDRYYASLPAAYETMYVEIERQLEEEKERITEDKRIKDSLELNKNIKTVRDTQSLPKKTTDVPQ